MFKKVMLGVMAVLLVLGYGFAYAGNNQDNISQSGLGNNQYAVTGNNNTLNSGTVNNYQGDYVADNAFGAEANALGVGVGVGVGVATVDNDVDNINDNTDININDNTDINNNSNFGINSQGQEQGQSQGQEQGQSQSQFGYIEQSFVYEVPREFVTPGTTPHTDLPEVRTSDEASAQEFKISDIVPDGTKLTKAQARDLAAGNGLFRRDVLIETDWLSTDDPTDAVVVVYTKPDTIAKGAIVLTGMRKGATPGQELGLAAMEAMRKGATVIFVAAQGVTEKSEVDGISLGGQVTGGGITETGRHSGVAVGGLGWAGGSSWQGRYPWLRIYAY